MSGGQDWAAGILNNEEEIAGESKYVFLQRISDGRFYRGATFWRWTKSWRLAAALPVYFWRDYVVHRIAGTERVDWKFMSLDDVCSHDNECGR